MREHAVKGIYFAYLGSLGLMVTYWPYHFAALGLTALHIGILMSVRTAISIVSQPWITALADRSGRPMRMLQFSLVAAFVIALGLPWATSFALIALLVWVQTPLQTSTLPLVDVQTLRLFGEKAYGRIRLWGSLGYGVCVLGFGLAFSHLPEARIGELSVWGYVLLAGVAALAVVLLRGEREVRASSAPLPFGRLLRDRRLQVFLGANALHWGAVMIFNVFFALLVLERGWSPRVPGLAVGVAIAGEVLAFLLVARFLTRERAAFWLMLVCGLGALRWVLTAVLLHSGAVIALQGVHFFSFGVWFYAALLVLLKDSDDADRGALQGLFMAASLGVGASIGTLAGGWVVDGWGAAAGFVLAALMEVGALALFAGWWRLRARGPEMSGTGLEPVR